MTDLLIRWLVVAGILVSAYLAGYWHRADADKTQEIRNEASYNQQVIVVKKINQQRQEISTNVNQDFKGAVSKSDNHFNGVHINGFAKGVTLSNIAPLTEGTIESTSPSISDTQGCNDKDSAADALQVIFLQKFYNEIRETELSASKELQGN